MNYEKKIMCRVKVTVRNSIICHLLWWTLWVINTINYWGLLKNCFIFLL